MPLPRIGTLLVRETRSYLKPSNRVSHTNKYTHHERLAAVQTRMTSERNSGIGAPTVEEQAYQTLHQDDTITSRNFVCSPISLVYFIIIPPMDLIPNLFNNLNICSTVNAHSNRCTNQKARFLPKKKNLGGEWSRPFCRSGVQRDRNPWSCKDRKGLTPEDQHFLSIS